MQKYDSYKDSGIQWLGEIPSHWETTKLKNIINNSQSGLWGEDAKQDGTDTLCIRVADFNYSNGNIRVNNLTYRHYGVELSTNKLLRKRDLLLEKSGGGDLYPVGRVVRYNLEDNKATCSNFIQKLTPIDSVDSDYIYYLFRTMYYLKVNGLYYNQTTGIQNLKVKEYLSQIVFLPPLSEQQAIAAYLDEQTAKIDTAIAQQQKMIDLLNERKQIIINNAVTKGLNPGAPMKDSGVDWIGEMPEHWEVTMLKKKSQIILGKMLSNAPGSQYEYFCAKDVHYNSADDTDLKQMNFTDSERQQYQVIKGDMLIVEGGAGAGGCAIYKGNKTAYIQNSIMIVRGNEDMINEYICYFMQSINKRGYIEFICNKATIPHFTKEKVGAVNIAVPPIEEQKAIIEYINKSCTPIDGAISTASKQISFLQERKQIIINDVVTGKIKVC